MRAMVVRVVIRSAAEGSTYGPDLTRIGGARSVKYLEESIVDPSADIPADYQGVTVVTKEGSRVVGVRVNEDSFTVQLRLPSQEFRSFVKDDAERSDPYERIADAGLQRYAEECAG